MKANDVFAFLNQSKSGYDAARVVAEKFKERVAWEVSIPEKDETSYRLVVGWLNDKIAGSRKQKATSSWEHDTKKINLNWLIADSKTFSFYLHGYKINVKVKEKDIYLSESSQDIIQGSNKKNEGELSFWTYKKEAFDLLKKELEKVITHREKDLNVWAQGKWGDWTVAGELGRPLNTVITSDNTKEDLLNDLRKFYESSEKYARVGVPYKRNILLHGPPGTGKTSLVKALATELELNLWYLNLGDVVEDGSLSAALRDIGSRGILLIEDIDSFYAANSREEKAEGLKTSGRKELSTSGLLNFLDGALTPRGLVVFLTTNHIEKLDTALLREGRVDRKVYMGHPDWEGVCQLWDLFFPGVAVGLERPAAPLEVSQAAVSEVLKSNWENENEARVALAKLIETP